MKIVSLVALVAVVTACSSSSSSHPSTKDSATQVLDAWCPRFQECDRPDYTASHFASVDDCVQKSAAMNPSDTESPCTQSQIDACVQTLKSATCADFVVHYGKGSEACPGC